MAGETSFLELARLLEALESTAKRNEKKALISSFLKQLRKDEIKSAISFLTGRAFPEADARVLEVGVRTVWKVLAESNQRLLDRVPLTILRVDKILDEVSKAWGKGSRRKRESLIKSLLVQSSPLERKYLLRLLLGEMRVGVVEGVALEAIAEAAAVDLNLVRRANMLLGDLGKTALTALEKGEKGLRGVSLKLFTPVKPMLAEMSYDLEEVFATHGGKTAFEYKFDGARVQIHKRSMDVRVFSRRLTDVTRSVPEVVEVAVEQVKAEEALLDGEVIALGFDGKPLPFQDLMRRFRRIHRVEAMTRMIPLRLYLFDILYLDGELLIDRSYEERWRILSTICPSSLLADRIVTDSISEAEGFLDLALRHGHEGLVAKALNSTYTPGSRGKRWFKIKHAETLDLVIVAADWGYGRREGWLSNYHLAVRSREADVYLNVGKTFKGLTDDEFKEMTRRLLEIKTGESGHTVYVKPEVVVEVAFSEIQRSRQYRSGFALRFARIARIRIDKRPEDADTIDRIRELYERQFKYKSRLQLEKLK